MPSNTERITNEFMDRNGYGNATPGAHGERTKDGEGRLHGGISQLSKQNCVLEMTAAAYERTSHLSAVS